MKLTGNNVVQQMLDFIFPPYCAGCRRSGSVLCPLCLAAIRTTPFLQCSLCHADITKVGRCQRCNTMPLRIHGLHAVSIYEDPLRACIHALKYKNNRRLAEPLGLLLAKAYKTSRLQADLIIPMPLHAEREQQRGYNQSALLARICSAQVGVTLYENLVSRQRATSPQVGLSMLARKQNVAGAFHCRAGSATRALLARKIVVIIDDVYTTGTTLEACAEPLFAAGARSVLGLVLARPAS